MSQHSTSLESRRTDEQACAAGPACPAQWPRTGGICWFRVLILLAVIALFVFGGMLRAPAADAAHGQQLAQSQCAGCHAVAPPGRGEVAVSPPFEVIARKYGHDAGRIAAAIAGPHPKMNFAPQPTQAADIAAYMAGLGK